MGVLPFYRTLPSLYRHITPIYIIYVLLLSSLHNEHLTGFVFYTDISDDIIIYYYYRLYTPYT